MCEPRAAADTSASGECVGCVLCLEGARGEELGRGLLQPTQVRLVSV